MKIQPKQNKTTRLEIDLRHLMQKKRKKKSIINIKMKNL